MPTVYAAVSRASARDAIVSLGNYLLLEMLQKPLDALSNVAHLLAMNQVCCAHKPLDKLGENELDVQVDLSAQ